MTDQATDSRLLRLSPGDNVYVLRAGLAAGETISVDGKHVAVRKAVALGHKIAAVDIKAGDKINKYNAPIGSAKVDIPAGTHVHTHNMKSDYLPTYTLDDDNLYVKQKAGNASGENATS